MISHWTQG